MSTFTSQILHPRFSIVVDERLAGERVRAIPRVYGRPLTLRVGLTVSEPDVTQRLNDLGYAQRDHVINGGEFAFERDTIVIAPTHTSRTSIGTVATGASSDPAGWGASSIFGTRIAITSPVGASPTITSGASMPSA